MPQPKAKAKGKRVLHINDCLHFLLAHENDDNENLRLEYSGDGCLWVKASYRAYYFQQTTEYPEILRKMIHRDFSTETTHLHDPPSNEPPSNEPDDKEDPAFGIGDEFLLRGHAFTVISIDGEEVVVSSTDINETTTLRYEDVERHIDAYLGVTK